MLRDDYGIRKHLLGTTIGLALPEVMKQCKDKGTKIVVLCQDDFATELEEQGILLLGMAVKYAGLCGKSVHVATREEIDEMGQELKNTVFITVRQER